MFRPPDLADTPEGPQNLSSDANPPLLSVKPVFSSRIAFWQLCPSRAKFPLNSRCIPAVFPLSGPNSRCIPAVRAKFPLYSRCIPAVFPLCSRCPPKRTWQSPESVKKSEKRRLFLHNFRFAGDFWVFASSQASCWCFLVFAPSSMDTYKFLSSGVLVLELCGNTRIFAFGLGITNAPTKQTPNHKEMCHYLLLDRIKVQPKRNKFGVVPKRLSLPVPTRTNNKQQTTNNKQQTKTNQPTNQPTNKQTNKQTTNNDKQRQTNTNNDKL